jgi:hypothetical protein
MYGNNSFLWNFGDGASSSTRNPSHLYAAAGVYTVSLTASNTDGIDVETKTNYLSVNAFLPIADFTQSVNYGAAPLTVNFTDLSANTPTAWWWNFDDGTTSAQQNPTHTFQTSGRYLISLMVSNSAGTDTRVNPYALSVFRGAVSNFAPVLDLEFNEGTGATAFDATTNQNHGTIWGATWSSISNNQFALLFHGGGQWYDGDAVVVPHSASLDLTNAFSVEARIKTASSDKYLGMVDKYAFTGPDNQSRGFTLYLTDGILRFSLYSGEHGNQDCWGTNDLRDNAWHVVKASWDGSYLRTYLDGNMQGQCAWPFAPADTTQDLGVGKRLSGWGAYMPFDGLIDYVIVSQLETAAAPPALLTLVLLGNQVLVSWESGGVLQSAPDLSGPWTDVANAWEPFLALPVGDRTFYRVRAP